MESFAATKIEFLNEIHIHQQQPQSSYGPLATQTGQNTDMSCRKKLDFDTSHKESIQRKIKVSKQENTLPSNFNFAKKQLNSQSNLQFPRIPSNTKRNARERKRVRTINDYFNQLQKYLPYSKPSQSTSSTPGPKKLSKVETLKAAIEFIEYLQQYAPTSHKINNKGSNSSSPSSSLNSSSVASSLQSSPSTSTTSFTSNMGLVEKLKIKCESSSKINKHVVNPLLTAGFDTTAVPSVYGNPSTNFSAQNSNTYSTELPVPVTAAKTTPVDNFYNYNMNGYNYSDSAMNYYTCHNNETGKIGYKSNQSEVITSSPTYSTSSSDCYVNYNNGINSVREGMVCATGGLGSDYNNNINNTAVCGGLRYNELPVANFQYHQYSSNTHEVQYC